MIWVELNTKAHYKIYLMKTNHEDINDSYC